MIFLNVILSERSELKNLLRSFDYVLRTSLRMTPL